uniref:Uncharacterized protein n=1 Tax=Leersia perrieri TaxID=77586 RepID=A0A0D9WYD6_9ORYZ
MNFTTQLLQLDNSASANCRSNSPSPSNSKLENPLNRVYTMIGFSKSQSLSAQTLLPSPSNQRNTGSGPYKKSIGP